MTMLVSAYCNMSKQLLNHIDGRYGNLFMSINGVYYYIYGILMGLVLHEVHMKLMNFSAFLCPNSLQFVIQIVS